MNNKQLLFRTLSSAVFAAVTFFNIAEVLAQVKIGDNPTVIKTSAALEVESTNKSFYPPRVALTSALISAPIIGLTSADQGATVYNTANTGTGLATVSEGICTWNGTKWVCVNSIQQTVSTAFSASKGNSQTIPANTLTKMTYVLENYDRGNDYNPGISTFSVTTAGIYQVTGCVTWPITSITGTEGRSIRLFKNSVQINGGLVSANMVGGVAYAACGSTNVLLAAGDYIELATHVGNVPITVTDATFEAIKISN